MLHTYRFFVIFFSIIIIIIDDAAYINVHGHICHSLNDGEEE